MRTILQKSMTLHKLLLIRFTHDTIFSKLVNIPSLKMVRPVKRRHSSVVKAKALVHAIRYIRQQKQIPNLDRIQKYMIRVYDTKPAETEKQLQYTCKDGLIIAYTTLGKKGNKTGIEQEGYRIPDEGELVKGDHDWYCFGCHNVGEVLPCSDCWRVFHPSCTKEEWTGPTFTCTICRAGRVRKLKRKMLNTLLSYTVMRMKEKTRELHKIGHREEEVNYSEFFVFKHSDLNTIENKVNNHKYRSLEEFLADTQLIYHNTHLIYGDEYKGGIAELARIMAKDCEHEVEEIKQCRSCYYLSNAKPDNWFCQPCDPPHELVYAKLKGYSYWPAKIIRRLGDRCDVRFFGGFHQRSLLPKESIKPVDINIQKLVTKRTAGFNKACDELKRYQENLANLPSQNDDEDDDKEESEASNEKEEVESEASKEKDDPYDFDSEMAANNETVSSDKDDSDGEADKDKKEVENSALEVSSTSSPPKKRPCLKVNAAEDIVTSSEDKVQAVPKVPTVTMATQTIKKSIKQQHSQTDSSTKCNCEEKFNKKMKEYQDKVEKEHEANTDKALKELSDRLLKDFEEDKQQAVSRATSSMVREIEKTKRQTEEKCKTEILDEMKKLQQKHKEAISQTKKKQWCYNCEEEAMYHCCWNTSYCSVKCQQEHWHKEHKRVCRRKR
ncbi:zinc finger MYND domain-containing protein 11-like [Mytilus trossulus]|uniref:zinc finger MYND domain-containing protein 11-like n=1 Tax=Mytilus trossulus TaxID=6551 RepID=UPI003004708D